MKLTAVIICLLFYINLVCAQIRDKDSLIYYSYIIHGKNKKEFLSSGTGSILRVNKKYYLVSNYHVLTGKDHASNTKLKETADTNTSISVTFLPVKKQRPLLMMSYRLYNKNGWPNFRSYYLNGKLLDISIMPVKIPRRAKRFALSINDIDTSGNYKNGTLLHCYGFPWGERKDDWKPTEFETKAVAVDTKDIPGRQAFVYFDRMPVKGMSGSPIYVRDSSGTYKFLSLQSNQVRPEYGRHTVKGSSIYALYVLKLIDGLKKERLKAVKGKTYPR